MPVDNIGECSAIKRITTKRKEEKRKKKKEKKKKRKEERELSDGEYINQTSL